MYPKQQRRPLRFLVYLSFFDNADPPRAHPPTQLFIVHWGLTERKQLHSGPASVVKVEQVRRVGGKCLNYTVSSLNVKYCTLLACSTSSVDILEDLSARGPYGTVVIQCPTSL